MSSEKECTVWIGKFSSGEPFIFLSKKKEPSPSPNGLLFTTEGERELTLASSKMSGEDLLRFLELFSGNPIENQKLSKSFASSVNMTPSSIKRIKFSSNLLGELSRISLFVKKLEDDNLKAIKVGLLYAKKGDKTEKDLFSNTNSKEQKKKVFFLKIMAWKNRRHK